jgi:hypothetical protein
MLVASRSAKSLMWTELPYSCSNPLMGVPWWLDIGLGMPESASKMRRVYGMSHLAAVAATRSGLYGV